MSLKDEIIKLHVKGHKARSIAVELKCDRGHVERVVQGFERRLKRNIRAAEGTRQNLANAPIGCTYLYKNRYVTIIERTSCSDCLVNRDHSYGELCTRDLCGKERRKDRTDVMYAVGAL